MVWGGKTMDFAIRLLEIREENAILLFIFPLFSILEGSRGKCGYLIFSIIFL